MPTTTKAADKNKGAKPAPAVKTLNDCLCGCGGKTGRRFMPGHDAKLKGQLLKTAVDTEAKPADRKVAEGRLNELGWSSHLTKAQESAQKRVKAAEDRADAKAKRQAEAAKAKAERAAKAKAEKERKADAEAAGKEKAAAAK